MRPQAQWRRSRVGIEGSPGEDFPVDGLLAYWKLDEGSGTTTSDSSGSGHTGTLTSSNIWTSSGKINSAIEADGSNYVDLGVANNLLSIPDSGFSIAFWVFMSADTDTVWPIHLGFNTSPSVSSRNSGLRVRILSGQLEFRIQQNLISGFNGGFRGAWRTGLFLQAGWNLCICNRTTTDADAYVFNNVEQVSNSISGSFGNLSFWQNRNNVINADFDDEDTFIASSPSGSRFDEIGIWDDALTESERDVLWNDGDGLQP
jgi:hypothetical protein